MFNGVKVVNFNFMHTYLFHIFQLRKSLFCLWELTEPFYSILFYSILYLHPIDHYNDKGHVKSNVQYVCCHTSIIISYELLT